MYIFKLFPQKKSTYTCKLNLLVLTIQYIFVLETAQSALGSDVNDTVITVPFDFGDKQKNALG